MGAEVLAFWERVGQNCGVALGSVSGQARFENPREVLGDRLNGLYRFLADEGCRLFDDDYFADLYMRSRLGRPTVPARVLATVMVLQAFEGLSDREAVDRLGRDLAWQAAAGVDIGHEASTPRCSLVTGIVCALLIDRNGSLMTPGSWPVSPV